MNCAEWEERIALYYGGDLPADETRAVEAHLADCAGCRLFAGGMKDALTVLQQAHADPLAGAHFAFVRARVLSRLAGERRGRRRWAWMYGAAAMAAAALLLAAGLWPRRPQRNAAPRIAPPVAAVSRPAPPEIHAAAVRIQRHPRRHFAAAKAHVAPAGPAAQPAKPLVVKLVTDDPNVVIYWITGKSGDGMND